MTFKQIKQCLWIMAISAAIFGNIGGYWLGKTETEKKYFTDENKCTVMLDNGGSVDGYCIETGKPSYPSDFIGPLPKPVPVPTPTQNYNFKEEK